MSFNSLAYFAFLPLVAVIYYSLRQSWRVPFLLLASWCFYLYGTWPHPWVLFLSSSVNFCVGRKLELETAHARRCFWLYLGTVSNLGLLIFFKYIHVGLPLGLSFFTFQGLAYLIDVFRNPSNCEKNYMHYLLFESFFPQLVSGPISRASQLLPQLKHNHHFSWRKIESGATLVLWGLAKKIFVAGHFAKIVDAVYATPANFHAADLFLATFYFSVQIYTDFSAYTDIARGSAAVLGLDLPENFKAPWLATSPRDFWHRWHLSLSTWFRDYLYLPMGGNKVGKLRWGITVLVVFILSGIWHGAGLTFILWGGVHGLALVFVSFMPKINILWAKRFMTFIFITLSWIFFRAQNIGDVGLIFSRLFGINHWIYSGIFSGPTFLINKSLFTSLVLVVIVYTIDSLAQKKNFILWLQNLPQLIRLNTLYLSVAVIVSYAVVDSLFYLGQDLGQKFIYFHF